MTKLTVLVFGCATKKRYQDELSTIETTYLRHCKTYGVPLYVFVEEDAHVVGEHYVRLPGVDDTYESNLPKTFSGLKWLVDHDPSLGSVLVVGSDAYPNIPKIVRYLDTLDTTQPLYIGGHGDVRPFHGEDLYFHSGGPGFLLTRTLIDQLYPILTVIPDDWKNRCTTASHAYLRAAGDVAVAYYIYHQCTYTVVNTPGITFSNCNYYGRPCHLGEQNPLTLMCCHLMQREDMIALTALFEQNNFFL
jgi:Fringe-like